MWEGFKGTSKLITEAVLFLMDMRIALLGQLKLPQIHQGLQESQLNWSY